MKESRTLAIDFGEKRIGIAVTDPLNIFAYPLVTLLNDCSIWEKLSSIIKEYSVEKIIIGFPVKESGANSIVSESVLKFKYEIEKRFFIISELVDERYSSKIAQQRILEKVSSKKKRKDKSMIDQNAAAVLLEDYLSKMKY